MAAENWLSSLDTGYTTSLSSTQNLESDLNGTEHSQGQETELLLDEEVVQLRDRVLGMGILNDNTAGPREKELAKMIMRLTEPSRPTLAQLANQASTISELSLQRDYLVQQAEEQRARWDSERAGWERASEALIAQRQNKDHYSKPHEELERYCSILQIDNQDLRHKDRELKTRLNCLENEMSKLKPLLLLKPFTSSSSSSLARASSYLSALPYPATTRGTAAAVQRIKLSRRKKKEQVDAAAASTANEDEIISISDIEHTMENSPSHDILGAGDDIDPTDAMDTDLDENRSLKDLALSPTLSGPWERAEAPGTLLLQPPILPVPTASASASTSTSQSSSGVTTRNATRKSVEGAALSPLTPRKGRASIVHSASSASPLTSDARTEHLLLAARKIGRQRTAIAAGIIDAELERDKAKEVQERTQSRKKKTKAGEKSRRSVTSTAAGKRKSRAAEAASRTTGTAVSNPKPPKKPATTTRGKDKGKAKEGVIIDNESAEPTTFQLAQLQMLPPALENADDAAFVEASASSQHRQAPRPRPKASLTPMDSLLSAARMMNSGAESSGAMTVTAEDGMRGIDSHQVSNASESGTARRTASTLDDSGVLPPAKRRKGLGMGQGQVQRVRSALDVLADQAAAAVTTTSVDAAHTGDGNRSRRGRAEDRRAETSREGEVVEEQEHASATTTKSGRKTKPTMKILTAGATPSASRARSRGSSSSKASTPRISPVISPIESRATPLRASTSRVIALPESQTTVKDTDTTTSTHL